MNKITQFLAIVLLSLVAVTAKANIDKSSDYTVSIQSTGTAPSWTSVPVFGCDVNLRNRQRASFAEFDLTEPVRVRITNNRSDALQNGKMRAVVRPASKGITCKTVDDRTVELSLTRPEYLSVEFNGDSLHNLHLFANPPLTETHTGEGEKTINWKGENAQDVFVKDANLIYFGPGVHQPKDLPSGDIHIPSNCTVYLAPGAIVKARLIVDHAHNVRIIGRGMLDHPLRGIEITFSRNVLVDGLTIVNPDHYTVFGGQSDSITLRNLKSFSCKSWTDGIDLMCCSNVSIKNVFLRTSDDCIALYNHRWWYWGGARNFDISDATLWADVAHSVNIGTHGDDRSQTGETLENVRIYNCDILHARTDAALKLASGDKNTLRDIHFDNIRMEDVDNTALIGLQVVFSEKYNRAPGNRIEDITFSNISYNGNADRLSPCYFKGFDAEHGISNVTLTNIRVNGKPMNKKNMTVGLFAEDITLKSK